MTAGHRLVTPVSANDLFKRGYGRTLRWSLLVALLLAALGAWLMPRYTPTPYVLKEDLIYWVPYEEPVDPELPLEKPVPPPPLPRIIEPVDDGPEIEVDYAETLIHPVETWVRFDPDIHSGEGFVASSSNPVLLNQPPPKYPEIMRMAGIEGVVVLKVLVGPNGLVDDALVIRSVHPVLDREALKAVRRCKFEPATQRTIPVRAWLEVPYRFRLR